MSRRAQPQDIEQQRLVVALPSIIEEATFRLPTVCHGRALILSPCPVGSAIERVGEGADLTFIRRIAVEVHACSQRAREQQSAVYRRQLALPRSPPGSHVEKMIVKALIAGRIRLGTLRAVPEEPQSRKRSLHGRVTRHETALDAHGVHRQRKAGRGNARGPVRSRLVDHQSIDGIRLVQKVAK